MTYHGKTRQAARCGAALIVLAFAAGCAAQASKAEQSGFDSKREVALPAEDLAFENINPAIRMATAWGNKGVGQHGTFGRFPAEFITPSHTHSGAYHGVVLTGEMTNPFKDEKNPPVMSPGSYWYVPAGAEHATACVSVEPCEFYFHAEQAFDFHPVE